MSRLLRYLEHGLAAIGLLYVVVSSSPAIDASILRVLSGAWNDPRGDILIVLGSDQLDDMIGESSYWRSVYATLVWREHEFRELVISGGGKSGAAPVARQMKDFLVCQGVPDSSIQIETQSSTTRENAVNTARLLAGRPGRKILLSSDYHALRAYRAFRKAGADVVPSPFPDSTKRISSWRGRWPVFLDLCVEISKIGYYSARGWI